VGRTNYSKQVQNFNSARQKQWAKQADLTSLARFATPTHDMLQTPPLWSWRWNWNLKNTQLSQYSWISITFKWFSKNICWMVTI